MNFKFVILTRIYNLFLKNISDHFFQISHVLFYLFVNYKEAIECSHSASIGIQDQWRDLESSAGIFWSPVLPSTSAKKLQIFPMQNVNILYIQVSLFLFNVPLFPVIFFSDQYSFFEFLLSCKFDVNKFSPLVFNVLHCDIFLQNIPQ